MSEPRARAAVGIAISPILAGHTGGRTLRERILDIAPAARLASISTDGLTDEPLDDVEVLLRGWSLGGDSLDRVVARAPRLRWIHSSAVGVESVLTPAVRARDLVITNGRGVFSRPIAEYVLTWILAVCRRLPQLLELERERTWQPLEALELGETTIGLVGIGSIGAEVAALAAPFGPRIVAIRRSAASGANAVPRPGAASASAVPGPSALPGPNAVRGVEVLGGPEALPELLRVSDFVVLALPLTPESESIINEESLAAVKPGAWLINVSRGALVDERALARALRDGPLAGAILDTFRHEPLPESSPFYRLPNCIVTPHTSWSSAAVVGRSIDLFCDNLRRYLDGEPLRYVVDPEAGY